MKLLNAALLVASAAAFNVNTPATLSTSLNGGKEELVTQAEGEMNILLTSTRVQHVFNMALTHSLTHPLTHSPSNHNYQPHPTPSP